MWYLHLTQTLYKFYTGMNFLPPSFFFNKLNLIIKYSDFRSIKFSNVTNYKSLYKLKTGVRKVHFSTLPQGNFNLLTKVNLLSYFKVYYRSSLLSDTVIFKAHSSWKYLYLTPNITTCYLNISRSFTKFKLFINLINSIFHFNLKILFLGSNFFKNEINALNWQSFKSIPVMWRYVYPILTIRPSRIFNDGWLVFYKLKFEGYNISFLLDASYHSKNLYYLNKAGIYTIGGVPLWYNASIVNFAIPMTSDSVISQVFLYRLILHFKGVSERGRFNALVNYWNNFQQIV